MAKFPQGFLVFILFVSVQSYSQKHLEPSIEEKSLAKTLKETFPDDHVAILESLDHITFDIDKRDKKVTVTHDERVTLLNLDSRADIQYYSFYDGESEITDFEVFTKNQKKAEFNIKNEAYKSDELFHNDVRVKYVNLDFPVKAFSYNTTVVKEYKDIKYFTSLYFNENYPAVKKVIKIEVPDWLDIEFKEINFDGYSIDKKISTPGKGVKVFTYTIENTHAVYDDKNSPGPSFIYPHILILAKSFKLNDEQIYLFNSTQDLYNWYKSLTNELVNDNTDFQAKVSELTDDAKSDEEKIRNIYYWIQDNIRYIAFEDGIAGFKPDEASNVFDKRYGDCKGMANLTKQMLLEAGFDARLTWIGTKRIAYDYSTPNLSVDNHMICSVFKDDKILYLDGTEKFNSLGEFADRIQGKQVLIENGEGFLLENIPIVDAEYNAEKINYNLKLVDEEITGKVTKQFQGESRSNLLYYFNSLKNDKRDEFLEYYLTNGNSNISVSGIQTTDLLNRDLELDISYDIEMQNAVSKFDNDIYIDLDIDKELANFEMNKRKTDYIFKSKKDIYSTFQLQIPEGYKVSHIPENIDISNPNYDLSVDFSHKGNLIIYEKHFTIRHAKIEEKNFSEWNGFIKKLNSVYNEQIILTKS